MWKIINQALKKNRSFRNGARKIGTNQTFVLLALNVVGFTHFSSKIQTPWNSIRIVPASSIHNGLNGSPCSTYEHWAMSVHSGMLSRRSYFYPISMLCTVETVKMNFWAHSPRIACLFSTVFWGIKKNTLGYFHFCFVWTFASLISICIRRAWSIYTNPTNVK